MRYSRGAIGPRLTHIIRAPEWWEYKLAPVAAVFYATSFTHGVAVSDSWWSLLTMLLALAACAAFVSVINDLTDRADDAASGKPNRFAGHSIASGLLLVAITVAAGVAFCILRRDEVTLVAVYVAAWVAFTLYSVPPFRLKTRGFAGVLADASGANLFPALVAVFAAQPRPRTEWVIAAGVWAFANGMRGILWHQLTDVANDEQAGARTFATRHDPRFVARIGTWIAFPFELIALAAMLMQMKSAWPAAFLAAYALLVYLRVLRWHMNVAIVAPRERFLIAMHEYYDAFLPVAILIASAARHPFDWIVLAVHLAIFPMRGWQVVRDAVKLWRERRYPSAW